jgi:predicted 2-oxoglutarate/Fe(II)-dependent dioxygenase YbiX/peroxiredoxin
MLLPGDMTPQFDAPSSVNPRFCFDTVAGRHVVISFFGSTQVPSSAEFLTQIVKHGARFDVTNAVFFGVTNDPDDVEAIKPGSPGRIYFYDLDYEISRKFGVISEVIRPDGSTPPTLTRKTFILDHALRVVAIIHMGDDDVPEQLQKIFAILDTLPKVGTLTMTPPVIVVPYVFEPELCKELISYYERVGGEDSGFMREENGKTVGKLDYAHKRRMDCEIVDQSVIRATHQRISRRLIPAIKQAYQFDVTRIERNIVACYDSAQGAHFRAHRDNTTLGTAHRRFAVTINLNSPEYEGGEIWFPEFGPKKYKAASGSAIVFSCSLLHEVPKVTRGKRYAFLPFLYDDAAAAIREKNRQHLGDLSGASGPQSPPKACATDSAAVAVKSRGLLPIIDGSSGCGHPEGCQTCLTSAAYEVEKPAAKPVGFAFSSSTISR